MVFYRYLFFAESPGTCLTPNPTEYTVFQAGVRCNATVGTTDPRAYLGLIAGSVFLPMMAGAPL